VSIFGGLREGGESNGLKVSRESPRCGLKKEENSCGLGGVRESSNPSKRPFEARHLEKTRNKKSSGRNTRAKCDGRGR